MTINDDRLDELLRDAEKSYRVPPAPPLDAIWDGVATELYPVAARRAPGWWTVAIAASLALALGIGGGRMSVQGTAQAVAVAPSLPTDEAATTRTVDAADPNQRTMQELLGQTGILLAALPSESATAPIGTGISREGARLLATTRLLLDSPLGNDIRTRNLLEDLEMVLAQVARLPQKRDHDELVFIRTALDENDIVPRLRSAVADLPVSNF